MIFIYFLYLHFDLFMWTFKTILNYIYHVTLIFNRVQLRSCHKHILNIFLKLNFDIYTIIIRFIYRVFATEHSS